MDGKEFGFPMSFSSRTTHGAARPNGARAGSERIFHASVPLGNEQSLVRHSAGGLRVPYGPARGRAGPVDAEIFAGVLKACAPRSVAVLGCAGGNGFDRISSAVTTRVVGVDINRSYVEELWASFQTRLPGLELVVGDVQREAVSFAPVELAFAALLLEYVDVPKVLARLRARLTANGILATVVQLAGSASSPVTPSRYASLQSLAPVMRLVPPDELRAAAQRAGYQEIASKRTEAAGGKQFQLQVFRLPRDERSARVQSATGLEEAAS
jgi:SAM-dependent methyltransferase